MIQPSQINDSLVNDFHNQVIRGLTWLPMNLIHQDKGVPAGEAKTNVLRLIELTNQNAPAFFQLIQLPLPKFRVQNIERLQRNIKIFGDIEAYLTYADAVITNYLPHMASGPFADIKAKWQQFKVKYMIF